MGDFEIQELCERGQRELIETDYLTAVDTFTAAERAAWEAKSFDTLARLYLPLQEARRQVRQRCGEGAVRMRLCSRSPGETMDSAQLLGETSQGQLLIAGWGSTAPAVQARRIAQREKMYVETFLAATFPTPDGTLLAVIAPLEESSLPTAEPRTIEQLWAVAPPHALVIPVDQLPADFARGNTESYAMGMALWERLHAPFLEAGDRETDPIKKMEAYRLALRVDPACELAHQNLAEAARACQRSTDA